MAIIIPDWVAPAPKPTKEPTGQQSTSHANAAAKGSTPADLQIMALARDAVIPIVYGGPERMTGLIYCVATPRVGAFAGKLVFAAILCEGPVESVAGFEVNGEPVPANIQITAYLGTPGQPIDPWLAASIEGFDETLAGTAYFVAVVTPVDSSGMPTITALVKGSIVFDPRENLVALSNNVLGQIYEATATQTEVAPDGTLTAWKVTDTSSAAYSSVWCGPDFAIPPTAGDVYRGAFRIKRTAGVTHLHGLDFVLYDDAFAVFVDAYVLFNSDDGSLVEYPGIPNEWWTVEVDPQDSSYWLVEARAVNPGGCVWVALGMYLYMSDFALTIPDDMTPIGGSVVVCWFQVTRGEERRPYVPTSGEQIYAGSRWSDNPALCLRDYMARWGALVVDESYAITAAQYCDALLAGAAGSEKRSTVTLALTTRMEIFTGIETLRQYVPAWVADAGDAWRIVADMPRAVDHSFAAGSIDGDPPPRIRRGGTRDIPNSVDVAFTDERTEPWQTLTATAQLPEAEVDARRNRVALPGIRRYSQAMRFAVERLNHYTLEDVSGSVDLFDAGLKVLRGDVIEISESAFGWSSKKARVLDARDKGNGRWQVDFREYDPLAYSGLVQTAPSTPDTSLASPLEVTPPTGFAAVEILSPESNLPSAGIGTGIIFQSRIHATWIDSVDPYIEHYLIRLYKGATEVTSARIERGVRSYLSQPLQQLADYRVDLYAVNSLGIRSPVQSIAVRVNGKLFPPGDVPSITEAFEAGGEVLLAWAPAADFDTLRYEWRIDLGNIGRTWATMAKLDSVDGLRARFRGIAQGTHRFCVRALDSVGNYSLGSRCVVLEVTADTDAFLSNHKFIAPDLGGMVELHSPFDEAESLFLRPRWVTSYATSWDASLPSPVDAGTEPVFRYGNFTGAPYWEGETFDYGVVVAGDFKVSASITIYTGTVDYYLGYSLDNVVWNYVYLVPGQAFKGSARFVKPGFEGSVGAAFLIEGPPEVQVTAVTKGESGGPTMSSASGFTRVLLIGQYSKAVGITVTPYNVGSVAVFPTVDNVVIGIGVPNTFDVYLFSDAGTLLAKNFVWSFQGI